MEATIFDWIGAQLAAGRYSVERAGGNTWSANYFVGLDRHRAAQVLIKALKPDMAQRYPQLAALLQQDYQTFKEFYHPNQVHFLDQGEAQGMPYQVLTFCEGGNLWTRMVKPTGGIQARPPEGLTGWLPGAARALDFLHQNGQLHGEVNPFRIQFDGEGQVRLAEPALTRPRFQPAHMGFIAWKGPRQGVARYFAPEWMEDRPLDRHAEQFSLALIVWEWLTGTPLYPGNTPTEVRQRQLMAGPLPKQLPEPWMEVLSQALAPRPEDRFPSCQDFAANLLARVDVSGAAVDTGGPVSFNLRFLDSHALAPEALKTVLPARMPVPPPIPPEAAVPVPPPSKIPAAAALALPPALPQSALPQSSVPGTSVPPTPGRRRLLLLALCLLFLALGVGAGMQLKEALAQGENTAGTAREKEVEGTGSGERLASLEKSLTERKNRIDRLEEELGETKKDLDAGRVSLKAEVELRRRVEKSLEGEKGRVKSLLGELDKAILALEAGSKDGAAKLKVEKDRFDKLTTEAEGLKTRLTDLETKLKLASKDHAEKHFEGIELEGKKVVLLIDTSGSMRMLDRDTEAPGKWKEVVEAIERVASSLEEVESFQVIAFGEKVYYPLGNKGKWFAYDKETPKRIADALLAIKPDGDTNLHAGLEETFTFRAIGLDTVFLFSDGLPNLGPGLAPGDADRLSYVDQGHKRGKHIRQLLQSTWNPGKSGERVRLNAIGFFYETPDLGAFLWALARENEGAFMGMSHP